MHRQHWRIDTFTCLLQELERAFDTSCKENGFTIDASKEPLQSASAKPYYFYSGSFG